MNHLAMAALVSLAIAGCLEEPTPLAVDATWPSEILAGQLQAVSPYGDGSITFYVDAVHGNITLAQVDNDDFEWIGHVVVQLVSPSGAAQTLIDARGAAGTLGSQAIEGESCMSCTATLPAETGLWRITYNVEGALVMPYQVLLA